MPHKAARLSVSRLTPKVVIAVDKLLDFAAEQPTERLPADRFCPSDQVIDGELFQYVDQPGGRLQDRQPLRQLRAAEGGVEQRERALVAGMPLRRLRRARSAARPARRDALRSRHSARESPRAAASRLGGRVGGRRSGMTINFNICNGRLASGDRSVNWCRQFRHVQGDAAINVTPRLHAAKQSLRIKWIRIYRRKSGCAFCSPSRC